MPPMCHTRGPDLGAELQKAVEDRLRDLGVTNPTEADIASAIAHEDGMPAFGCWIDWKPGDVIPNEWILADISSDFGESYMWVMASVVGTRDCKCIQRYCIPLKGVTS